VQTRLSVLLEDIALKERMSLYYVQMEHLGASLREYLSMIALTAPRDITAKVLG